MGENRGAEGICVNRAEGKMKAIITDLDRTLLRSDRTISSYTKNILQKCRDAGMYIAVATARPEKSVAAYQEQIGFDAIATLNGAKIFVGDTVIENEIPRASAETVLTRLMTIPDIMISIETGDGLFSSEDRPEWKAKFFPDFPKLPTEKPLYKILVSREKALSLRDIEVVLTEDTYCTAATRNLFQIMSRKATKWNGICTMLKHFGISEENVVYFGDDEDDLMPIQKCGVGVAVANAYPNILSAADCIAKSNDEDGVARFIETHVFGNKK